MASAGRPGTAVVWKAIEAYLRGAYDEDGPPTMVSSRLAQLRGCDEEAFYASPVLERDPKDCPCRYALRLGSRYYPPMKMVIERLPGREDWVFRADTHDDHVCPPPWDAEHKPFRELMERNRAVARVIEGRWHDEGLATFKDFLQHDLEERRAR